jgi:hypothetical protein
VCGAQRARRPKQILVARSYDPRLANDAYYC